MLPQRPDSEPTGLLHTVRLELDHFVGDRRRILIFVWRKEMEKRKKNRRILAQVGLLVAILFSVFELIERLDILTF